MPAGPPEIPPLPATPRYHHLDALRAAAMLLGIVLHALLSFTKPAFWVAQDIHGHPWYSYANHAIHGFRMPLFFLLSGFFTALLWRRYGTGKLVKHRLVRIGIPLVVGTMVFKPMIDSIGEWGGKRRAENRSAVVGNTDRGEEKPLSEAVRSLIAAGADLDAWSPEDGVTPLCWAAMEGHPESARLLLDAGADPSARNRDGATPLHGAAFLGRDEMVALLVESGADVNAVQPGHESTPLDSAYSDWQTVEWIAGLLGIGVEREAVRAGRERAIAILREHDARRNHEGGGIDSPSRSGRGWRALVGSIGFNLFHHLWFLYDLLWLSLVFVLLALLARAIGRPLVQNAFFAAPWRWLWIVPLTILAQLTMPMTFGPDTFTGLIPMPTALGYYAIFFFTGAVVHARREMDRPSGKGWLLCLLFSIPVFALGMWALEQRKESFPAFHLLTCLTGVLYAWLMVYGSIGLFRTLFRGGAGYSATSPTPPTGSTWPTCR